MGKNIKTLLGTLVFLGVISIFGTGCVEHRYYRENHHHSPDYYHRHHQAPPPGVDINIHN